MFVFVYSPGADFGWEKTVINSEPDFHIIIPCVVGKVRDWMDKNIDITPAASKVSPTMSDSNKSIPQGPKLVTYIQNSAGSNHVQAVLSTSNLSLARYDRHF